MDLVDFISDQVFLLATTLAIVLLIPVIKLHTRRSPGKKKRYHPVAGTVLHQLVNFHRLHHYMTDLACKYRSYRLLNLCRHEVYTAEPANIEYFLKTNFANYGKVLQILNISHNKFCMVL